MTRPLFTGCPEWDLYHRQPDAVEESDGQLAWGVGVIAEVQKRPIPGYEGIYEAGDDGEIYSVARYCACGPGMQGKRFVRSRKLKKNMQRFKLGGYQVKVSLYKETKLASMKVKQLVAMAWLGWTEGPILLADGDHMNTRPDNLRPVSNGEWNDQG